MDAKFDLNNAFIICDDGTWVPFVGVTEVQLSEDDTDLNDIDPDAIYAHFPEAMEPITFELDMKRRDHRKMLKSFNKQVNSYSRKVRSYKRKKERARRMALKG